MGIKHWVKNGPSICSHGFIRQNHIRSLVTVHRAQADSWSGSLVLRTTWCPGVLEQSRTWSFGLLVAGRKRVTACEVCVLLYEDKYNTKKYSVNTVNNTGTAYLWRNVPLNDFIIMFLLVYNVWVSCIVGATTHHNHFYNNHQSKREPKLCGLHSNSNRSSIVNKLM